MCEIYQRTEMLIGKAAAEKLRESHIMIFGIGGVGSYTAEAVARVGVGKITLVDKDVVSLSNINRQLIALHSTVGLPKVEVMKTRILDINPSTVVNAVEKFCLPENIDDFFQTPVSYVIDAIDTVSAKLSLIEKCKKMNIPIISAMGAGNKLNPLDFLIDDIYNTKECPLCRVMRQELRKRNVKELKVVYSMEKPIKSVNIKDTESKKPIPGSISFVPSVMGLILAGEAVKDIISPL